jgi:UDP-glucuronate 4-epimerase
MKILITGCNGFIGSHLCETLLRLNNIKLGPIQILGIDNMNNYYDTSKKLKNLQHIQLTAKHHNNDSFIFMQEDIRNTKCIIEWKPNIVIHLAAMAGVRYSIQNPSLYTDININGFINIIEQCRLIGCRLIYASSSSVYGLNTKVPFNEDDPIKKCNSPYAASKLSKEIFANMYSQLYNIETIGLRFFTVYGPRGRPDMAPYKFITKIMNGEIIDKYGDGNSMRDYTYISDIVSGIISCITVKLKNNSEIYNLGNENPISLNEFIETCEKVTGKKAIINYMNNQDGDVPITYANISKAKEELEYSPKVKILEGLTYVYNSLVN